MLTSCHASRRTGHPSGAVRRDRSGKATTRAEPGERSAAGWRARQGEEVRRRRGQDHRMGPCQAALPDIGTPNGQGCGDRRRNGFAVTARFQRRSHGDQGRVGILGGRLRPGRLRRARHARTRRVHMHAGMGGGVHVPVQQGHHALQQGEEKDEGAWG